MVVFEGIMAFCHAPLLKLMDLKIFVDTDSDIRLARRLAIVEGHVPTFLPSVCSVLSRLHRDIAERGRDLEGVLKQYSKFVKPVSPLHLSTISRRKKTVKPPKKDPPNKGHLVLARTNIISVHYL